MPGYQVKLAGREPIAEGTLALRFEKPAGFSFKPGQAVMLELLDPPAADGQKRAHVARQGPCDELAIGQ